MPLTAMLTSCSTDANHVYQKKIPAQAIIAKDCQLDFKELEQSRPLLQQQQDSKLMFKHGT
jgi:hypothetical protein